jgi:hypothetical protein
LSYTAQEIKEQTKVGAWTLHRCSICRAPIQYVFDGDYVAFDSNCDCTSYWTPRQQRSWQDVADTINMQSEPVQQRMLGELRGEPSP